VKNDARAGEQIAVGVKAESKRTLHAARASIFGVLQRSLRP